MHQRQERKNFPSIEEYRESHRDWLLGYGWSLDYIWHEHDHAACKRVPSGVWKLMSFGFYQGSDRLHRLYQSHRCTGCGVMVQHNQLCDLQGNPEGAITRLVILP